MSDAVDGAVDGAVDDDALASLASRLTTRALGRVHRHVPALASTNDAAMRWACEGAVHGALVTADAQTAGRGRLGRRWSSPPGAGIYASVIVRPPGDARALAWGALGLAVAVGLREGLLPWAPALALKWPNDLLHGGRKLAGILCETRWSGVGADARPQVVVGFGINVGACPPEVSTIATSLARDGARAPGRAEVLARVLAALEEALDVFFGAVGRGARAGGFAAIRERYEPHCVTLGRVISIPGPSGARDPDRRREVRVLGLAEDGALWVEPLAGGSRFRVDSVPP